MSKKGAAAKTGAHCTISRTSPMVDTNVLPYLSEIDDDDVVSDYRDPALTDREFLPAGRFPENEQKWALTVLSRSAAAEPNLLRLFYVKFLAQPETGHTEIRLIHEVRNGNACKWEITNLGGPASSLPDVNGTKRVMERLKTWKIKRGDGAWSGKEWDCVLASLDKLTDDELKRIAGVEIRRDRAGSPASLGGKYRQLDHVIYLYDRGMEHHERFVLGTNPKALLPGAAHTVLHEIGHAIAYAPVREAIAKVRAKATAMVSVWGNEAFVFHESTQSRGDFDDYSYTYSANENAVSKERQTQFNADVDAFKNLDANIEPAARASALSKFKELVSKKKIPAVTPYSKARGEEEFFCDSFSLWKWYPEWLEKHRNDVFTFFSKNSHLTA